MTATICSSVKRALRIAPSESGASLSRNSWSEIPGAGQSRAEAGAQAATRTGHGWPRRTPKLWVSHDRGDPQRCDYPGIVEGSWPKKKRPPVRRGLALFIAGQGHQSARRGRSRAALVRHYCSLSTSMSLTESSSTEKSTATMVPSLPITTAAWLASLNLIDAWRGGGGRGGDSLTRLTLVFGSPPHGSNYRHLKFIFLHGRPPIRS